MDKLTVYLLPLHYRYDEYLEFCFYHELDYELLYELTSQNNV
jgi:hypothetical protein